MRYLPHTEEEIRSMLAAAGKQDIKELFETIPEASRLKGELNIPEPVGEAQLMRHLKELAKKNSGVERISFLGGGMYNHHIPPAVDQLILRSEFYTAYTPYQPEVAQGTLLAIWEFQTMVSELYGLPLSNASLYDGASATAEGVLMARRLTRRSEVLMSQCVHPQYRETTLSYMKGSFEEDKEVPIHTINMSDRGCADVDVLISALSPQTACVVVGYPSYVGPMADLKRLAEACHAQGVLLVVSVVEPYALALAEPPGAWGADIVVGEGQPLACPPQFGGPGVGLLACRHDRKFLQQLPGRVCGETVDKTGKRGWVLTLSTREQHIRRERATSNICTNQGLLALAFAIRVSLLGKEGFKEVAKYCLSKAEYLKAELLKVDGLSLRFAAANDCPTFNEFALKVTASRSLDEVCASLADAGYQAGVPLVQLEDGFEDTLLIAVTENHTKEDLDGFVRAFEATLS